MDASGDHRYTIIWLPDMLESASQCARNLRKADLGFVHTTVRVVEPPSIKDRGWKRKAWWRMRDFSSRFQNDRFFDLCVSCDELVFGAASRVVDVVHDELTKGTAVTAIALGGCGQGGALALVVALCCLPFSVCAVACHGAWLPLMSRVFYDGGMALSCPQCVYHRGLPVLMSHGQDDRHVPFHSWALLSYHVLHQLGAGVTWAPAHGGHVMDAQHWGSLLGWLDARLAESPEAAPEAPVSGMRHTRGQEPFVFSVVIRPIHVSSYVHAWVVAGPYMAGPYMAQPVSAHPLGAYAQPPPAQGGHYLGPCS